MLSSSKIGWDAEKEHVVGLKNTIYILLYYIIWSCLNKIQ